MFCGLIGILFVGLPVFPLYIHEHQLQELLNGSAALWIQAGLTYVAAASIGFTALYIAAVGRAPAWLVRAFSR
jgi:hypothetical protein